MGGNRLCTLTVRQSDSLGYMTIDDWAKSFARFVRLLRSAGLMNDYVAILEPHKKGLEKLLERGRTDGADARPPAANAPVWDIPLHMHFVTRSQFKMPINLMRKCWLAACGRDGNIDVQWLKAKNDSDDAISKVASYATKYITKGLDEFERFNKKRYWAAGLPLLPKGREWMRSADFTGAFHEVMKRLDLRFEDLSFLIKTNSLFMFPDGSGAWFNIRPHPRPPPPPF
jgi:hypothetical protein